MSVLNNSDSSNISAELLSEEVKKRLEKASVEKWDLFLLDEMVNGIYFRKSEHELITDSRNLGYYLRIFLDKEEDKMGIGLLNSNSTRIEDIDSVIKYARKISELNIESKYDLVGTDITYPSPSTTEQNILSDPVGFLENKSDEIKDIMKSNSLVHPTFGKFRVYCNKKMLLNSEGLGLKELNTHFYYEFSLKAEDSPKLAEYWPDTYVKHSSQLKFDKLFPKWATFAKDMLSAKVPNSKESVEVLFSPKVVYTAIMGTLAFSSTARAFYEKMSRLKIEDKVATEDFSMIDDGLLEGGLGTSAWDGEGNPKQTTTIIKNGIMKNYLYDQKYSSLLKTKSTGNGKRNLEQGGSIGTGVNNLIINPGSQSKNEMIEDITDGIYIDGFSWLNPDPITGTFGAEIRTAYLIKNGEIGQPIKGGNLSGNVFEMVKNITGISREREYAKGNSLVPWMKFKNLMLSGK
ncbi:MAG: metallopeptidase TldD-related protein [Promethearchaeota archaeon]